MNTSHENILNESASNPDKIDFTKIFKSDYVDSHSSEKLYKSLITSPSNLFSSLKTSAQKGIDTKDKKTMSWRRTVYGTNTIPEDEPLSIIAMIMECFEDQTLRVLLISAIVSLVIGLFKDGIKTGWIEGSAIFSAVFIVVGISSYLNYNEKLQYRMLSKENKMKNVLVIRDGIEKEISNEDLLVGDLLLLKIGDIIDVDGLLVGNDTVKVDESSVNGESQLANKTENFIDKNGKYSTPILLSGTEVQDGKGKMIVCAVGEDSFSGRNKKLIQSTENKGEEDVTPLKKQLDDLAELIGNFGYISAILIGGIMIVKEIIVRIKNGEGVFNTDMLDVIVNAFILAVTVIVVAIPEGLPMAVAIALAYSLQKMKNEHNLVKNLNNSETMGNCNNVCTDKTGTLTLGEMKVNSVYMYNMSYEIDKDHLEKEMIKEIKENIVRNISVVKSEDINGNNVLIGDMTEKALFKFIEENKEDDKFDMSKDTIVLPFKSDYKFMMTICKNKDNSYTLYAKGAYEQLIEYISKVKISNNKNENINKDKISKILFQYANDSKRTIIFAKKTLSEEEIKSSEKSHPEKDIEFFKSLSKDLELQFIIGITDPLRTDVPSSIATCKRAGITVRMVTGDNLLTAMAISKLAGIITEEEIIESKKINEKNTSLLNTTFKSTDITCPIALSGNEFRVLSGGLTSKKEQDKVIIELNDIEKFKKTVSKLKIIARASPEDKFLLVFGLKKTNNIVAVTGDGTNDAPALKTAHVGFAMGKRGTDIAKEAADIILLDDSFSSIITACKFGRNVYDCIRKFIQFQLTTNVVAVFMSLLGGIVLKDSPLNCIEMLWVNLIMDSFASLALATESPTQALLERKPYRREDSLLTPMMIVNILTQGIFQIIVLSIVLFYGDVIFNVPSDRDLTHFIWNETNGYHFTLFFDVFVFLQVFNSINARKLRKSEKNVFIGIFSNYYYLIVQIFIVIGQIMIVTFGGRAVRVKRLSIIQHVQCAIISSLSLLVGYIVKVVMCKGKKKIIETDNEPEAESFRSDTEKRKLK